MLVAVLSDIHGNRQAFEAVLDAAREAGVQERWCLGDLVGYGADPSACIALAREHVDRCLAGNHDLAVAGAISIEEFSRGAAIAAAWTHAELSPDELAWLRGLPSADAAEGVGLFHGSPRDPVWEYVLSELQAELCFDVLEQRVALVGHSHVALAFHRAGREAAYGGLRSAGEQVDLSADEWLLNPGSVGQPRDGDPRAAWLLLDTDAQRAEWRRTAYDVEGAGAAIRAAGLPSALADRLALGR